MKPEPTDFAVADLRAIPVTGDTSAAVRNPQHDERLRIARACEERVGFMAMTGLN